MRVSSCFIGLLCLISFNLFAGEESLFEYAQNKKLDFRVVLGAANEFKEGDMAAGVGTSDEKFRLEARKALLNTKLGEMLKHPIYEDEQSKFAFKGIDTTPLAHWTFGDLKKFVLEKDEDSIKKEVMPHLNSDLIACLVRLMSNEELIEVGKKIFNPLPGSHIGEKGYMGARIQPNSPTDNPEDIQWQVFNAFSYGVGDVVLGNNPVDSQVESVYQVENALKDVVDTFQLSKVLPWVVLAHIDIQDKVEKKHPKSTALFFQSLAGVETAAHTFDISTKKMVKYAGERKGPYAFYFETGQGADVTNGHGHGFDIVIHESRKYGLAKALKMKVMTVKVPVWMIVNDVAGFIGPEVFRTKEQLVRTCLEDIVMGKLHGLTIGLDVCTTLHMSVTLDDLTWCLDHIMPANPAYLMALPTRNDPMLSYLTTSFQDHVRIREKFSYKVNDDMWKFFKELQVIKDDGSPTEHFGDPLWVYYQFRLKKGDKRSKEIIYEEGTKAMKRVETRGVPLALSYGEHPYDLNKSLDDKIHKLYNEAKESIWSELDENFINKNVTHVKWLSSEALSREDYINHPPKGEILNGESQKIVQAEQKNILDANYDVQIVISDGLNASSLMDSDHLLPYLKSLRENLSKSGYKVSPTHFVIKGGRVRAGYRLGEILFSKGKSEERKILIHIIGERPGNGHETFSSYLVAPKVSDWKKGGIDHNQAMLVSGIADSALEPSLAAKETLDIIKNMMKPQSNKKMRKNEKLF